MSYVNEKLSNEIKCWPECMMQFVLHACDVHCQLPDAIQVQVPQSYDKIMFELYMIIIVLCLTEDDGLSSPIGYD